MPKKSYKLEIRKKAMNLQWEKDAKYTRVGAAQARVTNLLREVDEKGLPKWNKVAIIFEQPKGELTRREK